MDEITLEDLRQYRAIRAEISSIEAEVESLYYPVSSPPLMSESGHGSGPSDPTVKAFHQIERDRERLDKKHAELVHQQIRIDRWLDKLENRHIAAIIRLHFIVGLSWRQTCLRVYGYPDPDICRMAVKRFFEKQ